MATHGMEELDLWFAFLDENEEYRDMINSVKLTDYQNLAMELLEHHIKLDCLHIIPNGNDTDGEHSTVVRDNDKAEAEEVDEMEELRRKRAKESERAEKN